MIALALITLYLKSPISSAISLSLFAAALRAPGVPGEGASEGDTAANINRDTSSPKRNAHQNGAWQHTTTAQLLLAANAANCCPDCLW